MKLFFATAAIIVALFQTTIGAITIPDAARISRARIYPAVGIIQTPWIPSSVDFFAHNEQFEVQPNDNAWIGWTPNEQTNVISFTLAVNSVGWVGFGPSETGGMKGASMCVVIDAQIFAMHSDDFVTPSLNADQNCVLTSYSRVGNETLLSFTRPMIGCKPDDVDIVGDHTTRMIMAYGDTQSFVYHGASNRFTVEINAVEGPITPPDLPDDAFELPITLNAMEIPAYRDVYFCKGHRFPSDKRYHILVSEAIMFNIAPATYHHSLLFSCPGGLPPSWEDGENDVCGVIPALACSIYFTGWATGQSALYYTEGLPVGAGEGAVVDFLFQGHIDNPYLTPGIYEPGWGLMFTLTETLLPIESGTFGLYSGVPLGGIPAGIQSFVVQSECTGRMTANAFPEGMWITAVTPHMHGIGVSHEIEVLRENEDGEWYQAMVIWTQRSWDNNWQGNRFLRHPGVFIEPGDRLRIRCEFNTMNRTQETRNGEGFEDEMCINYISYYPRTQISICAEFPPTAISHPEMSGPGLTFSDVAPFFFPIGPAEFIPLPQEPNNCNNTKLVGF